jgi:hypothetical protein
MPVLVVALAGCSSRHSSAAGPPSGTASSGTASSGTASSGVASVAPAPATVLSPGAGAGSLSGSVVVVSATIGSSVRLVKGQVMLVTVPVSMNVSASDAVKYTLDPANSTVVKPVAAKVGYFTAAADGTVTISVTSQPTCSAGVACAAHVLNVGVITVTVTG